MTLSERIERGPDRRQTDKPVEQERRESPFTRRAREGKLPTTDLTGKGE